MTPEIRTNAPTCGAGYHAYIGSWRDLIPKGTRCECKQATLDRDIKVENARSVLIREAPTT